jgi:hypothetical protein
MIEEFSTTHIDQEDRNDKYWLQNENQTKEQFQNMISNDKILLLKNNQIPKGLIPLESIFYHNDISIKPFIQPRLDEVEYCNIGT